jgi:hypothetical protein
MELFFNLVFGFVLGFVIFKTIQIILAVIQFQRLIKQVDQAVDQAVEKAIIRVKVEKHHDTYYLFNEATDEFIAQGKDMQELKDRCDQRFPRNLIVANDEALLQAGLKKN